MAMNGDRPKQHQKGNIRAIFSPYWVFYRSEGFPFSHRRCLALAIYVQTLTLDTAFYTPCTQKVNRLRRFQNYLQGR